MNNNLSNYTAATRAFRMLFMRPDNSGKLVCRENMLYAEQLTLIYRIFELLAQKTPAVDDIEKCCDLWNLLADNSLKKELFSFEDVILQSAFEIIISAEPENFSEGEESIFVREKLADIFQGAANWQYSADAENMLTRRAKIMLANIRPLSADELKNKLFECDPFHKCRTFRYINDRFEISGLKETHKMEDFFGFLSVRKIFAEHFRDFTNGKGNYPLIISSLPGHGKTQLTIAHALQYTDITLILATPDALEEGFAALLAKLEKRSDRKFVLFFDDIVPDELDWYYFRTHVGGSFSTPDNVLICLASNYHFPPSIISRGRSVLFPVFDEIRCMEMVEEFLKSCHLNKPPNNLILMIASDYTEHFGQKRFSELSPRTLMRYLAQYKTDKNKRKTMLDLSYGEVITRPDAQLFYEFNVELMRKLYGNEFIENMLKDRLREMEKG
ncbi:MAG: DUF815 domain-containing protein [Lentisphaeria bacterium]|nr:DUF815 domain-containing protein [Lentisphaeria bacterium]